MVTKSFQFEENKLVYDEYGKGAKVVVLLPGLLFSRQMHRPLAEALEERGHRVLCLDFLGHGDSDRPPEMWNYGVSIFGRQSIALLDHAGVDKAVIGGTSLGANATLEAAAAAPDRVRGMLIEMPVLDNALVGCALAFTPLLVGLTFGVRRSHGTGAACSRRSGPAAPASVAIASERLAAPRRQSRASMEPHSTHAGAHAAASHSRWLLDTPERLSGQPLAVDDQN